MDRFQRDCQWLINSPEFLAIPSNLSLKAQLQLSSIPHKCYLTKPHRLGVYFEQLWQNIIATNNDYYTQMHNQQVIIDKHTYGEFDSLLRRRSGDYLHCELAVKFYLQIGEGSALSDWVGPNLKDRFDIKYRRLFDHQLALSKQPLVKKWLWQRNIHIEQSKLLTRGRLFYPFENFIKLKFEFPQQVNPEHLKGFWILEEQVDDLINDSQFEWFLIGKKYWLSELSEKELVSDEIIKLDKPSKQFDEISKNSLYKTMHKIVALAGGKEVMRGFVVSREWLDKAKQRVSE